MEALHQRQQQALELAQHALHGAFIEVALVIGEVQTELIARIAHRRQREVRVGATGVRGGILALRAVEHRDFHRGVFEHEQAVEQRLALRQFAEFLDRHQRQVFVLAQLTIQELGELPKGSSPSSWIVTSGRYSYSRSCILLSSRPLNHWRTLQRWPSSGSFTRSALLLMNKPTVRCMSGMSTGRPATVTPNSTSRSPLKPRSNRSPAAWANLSTVSRWTWATSRSCAP